LRILFWNETYLPVAGGVENMTAALAKGLRARGHEVAVVAEASAPHLSAVEVLDGIPVHRFGFYAGLSALAAANADAMPLLAAVDRGVRKLKAEFRPDIVHVNLAGANPLFHLRSANAWPAASIVMLQAPLTEAAGQAALVTRLVASATRVAAASRAAAAHFVKFAGYSGPVAAIFPGVDPLDFTPSSRANASTPLSIVAMGRLVRDKGFDVAIRAMVPLRGVARLTIAGEGPAEAELRALIATLGLGADVDLVGRIGDEQRREVLAGAYAMAVPSRHLELFGMVAAEGAFSELPVVASNMGGLGEIVVDGETGFLVPPDDAQALATALARLCADRALADRLGVAARARATRLFSSTTLVDRFEALYADALGERPPAITRP
jgi:glycogen(starch) synthase